MGELLWMHKSISHYLAGGLMSYFRGLFGQREMRILILGLDGAGKTALINQAKHLFMTPDSTNASLSRVGRPQGVVRSQLNT